MTDPLREIDGLIEDEKSQALSRFESHPFTVAGAGGVGRSQARPRVAFAALVAALVATAVLTAGRRPFSGRHVPRAETVEAALRRATPAAARRPPEVRTSATADVAWTVEAALWRGRSRRLDRDAVERIVASALGVHAAASRSELPGGRLSPGLDRRIERLRAGQLERLLRRHWIG